MPFMRAGGDGGRGGFSSLPHNSMGWRQIIESRHRTADLSDWHGKTEGTRSLRTEPRFRWKQLAGAGPRRAANASSDNPSFNGAEILNQKEVNVMLERATVLRKTNRYAHSAARRRYPQLQRANHRRYCVTTPESSKQK